VYVLARVLLKVCARDAKALQALRGVHLQEAAAADRNVVLAAVMHKGSSSSSSSRGE
jgi:hypothetical protein